MIYAILHALGLTPTDVARRTGVHLTTVTRAIERHRVPRLDRPQIVTADVVEAIVLASRYDARIKPPDRLVRWGESHYVIPPCITP